MVANFEALRNEIKLYVDEVRLELPIDKAILFGSYAKGNANESSDVDIAFFIRDFGGKTRFEIGLTLLKLTHDYNAYIEPLVFQTSEIERGNPFVHEILRTGHEI